MKDSAIYTYRTDTKEGFEALHEFLFSPKMKIGVILAAATLAIIAAASGGSAEERSLSAAIACFAIVAAVMLCLRSKYALHAWAVVLATMSVGEAVLSDVSHEGIIYWASRILTALSLMWFAYFLFKLGSRIASGYRSS